MAADESELMGRARERLSDLVSVPDIDAALSAIWLNMLGRRHAVLIQSVSRSVELDENEAAIILALGLQAPRALTAAELKATLMVTSGGITRASDRLIDKGLVDRNEHPDDGRRVQLRLTATGRRRFEKLLGTLVDRQEERLSQLSPERRLEILAALDDLLTLYADIDVPR